MGFCVCVGCKNDTVKNKREGVSFHKFPSDEKFRKAWEAAIGRTEYPKTGMVCSEHFTDDCFMSSNAFRQKYCGSSTPVRRTRPQLKPNAIPTIFKHKQEPVERQNTVRRIQAKEHKELIDNLLTETANADNDVVFNIEESIEATNTRDMSSGLQSPTSLHSPFNASLLSPIRQSSSSLQSNSKASCQQTPSEISSSSTRKFTKDAYVDTNILRRNTTRHYACQFKVKMKSVGTQTNFEDGCSNCGYKVVDVPTRSESSGDEEASSDDDDNNYYGSGYDSSSDDENDANKQKNINENENELLIEAEITSNDLQTEENCNINDKTIENNNLDGERVQEKPEITWNDLQTDEHCNINDKTNENNNLDGATVQEKINESMMSNFTAASSVPDDVNADPDYDPNESLNIEDGATNDDEDDDDDDDDDGDENVNSNRCFLVYEKQLQQLLAHCIICGDKMDVTETNETKSTGSQYAIKMRCFSGHSYTWKSQPDLHHVTGVGNVDLVSAITLAGIPYSKFDKLAWLLNMKCFKPSTFYRIRRQYLDPVIRDTWNKESKKVIDEVKAGVILIGDGRCDSPGHSAKYCIYTMMDSKTGSILDSAVISVVDVRNSNAMEKAGFIKVINNLLDKGVKITMVSTDRHNQIRKLMKNDPKYKDIIHVIDPWHVIKGMKKKLNAAAKKKDCEDISNWVESVANHFWWSLSTCSSNVDFVERFQSVVHHVINKHHWTGNKTFKKCEHEKIKRSKTEWMDPNSAAYKKFRDIIVNTRVTNDLLQIEDGVHTTLLEVYHNVISKYLPKLYHFEFDHMELGTMLAALDNNMNVGRKQKATINVNKNSIKVKRHFQVAYRKPSHKFVARKFYEKKTYGYMKDMMAETRVHVHEGKKNKSLPQRKRMAPAEREPRRDLIEKCIKYSRFT